MRTFEEATSPLTSSNDGRLKVRREPLVEDGIIVVDERTSPPHVELFTRKRELADAFVAGYDYRERLDREEAVRREAHGAQ